MSTWYKLSTADVEQQLATNVAHGLEETESERRRAEHGHNELVEHGLKSPWLIFWEQLTATMVVILIIAALVSAVLGDYKDAVAILIIVVLNALLGFNQEYRAEKAMAALKRMAVPFVKVRRGGHLKEISARDLVPGDIVLLETGNLIPADSRLLESINLRALEAALTGESEPVEKVTGALEGADLPPRPTAGPTPRPRVVHAVGGRPAGVNEIRRTRPARVVGVLKAKTPTALAGRVRPADHARTIFSRPSATFLVALRLSTTTRACWTMNP